MTVSNLARRIAYVGNGVATSFDVPFQFFEVAVYVSGILLEAGIDYTIEQTSPGAEGTVLFLTPPAEGVPVAIVGATDQVQELDLVDNDSAPAELYEAALDRLTMALQEATTKRLQTLRAGEFAPPLPELDFEGNPGTFIVVGPDGVPVLEDISDPSNPLLANLAAQIAAVQAAASSVQTAANEAVTAATTAEAEVQEAATEATTAIENAAANFALLYLGPHATAPTTNNSGGPLVEGNLYLNSTTGILNIRHAGAWVTAFLPTTSGVATFNSRTGSVSPANGDYTAAQITNTPAGNIASSTVQDAINELDSEKASAAALSAVSSALSGKLDAGSYTAADVLAKLLTVDGAGSGLDADKLDGFTSADFSKTLRTVMFPTSSFSLDASHVGAVVFSNSASAMTLTINPDSTLALPDGTQVDLGRWGAGTFTIVPGSGVSLASYQNKTALAGIGATATLLKVAANTWLLTGNLA